MKSTYLKSNKLLSVQFLIDTKTPHRETARVTRPSRAKRNHNIDYDLE